MATQKVTCPDPACAWRFEAVVQPDHRTTICPRCKTKFAVRSADSSLQEPPTSNAAEASVGTTLPPGDRREGKPGKTYIPLLRYQGSVLLYAVKDGESPPTEEEFQRLVINSSAASVLAEFQVRYGGFPAVYLTADYLAQVAQGAKFPEGIIQSRYDEIQFGLMAAATASLSRQGILKKGVAEPCLLHHEGNLYLFAIRPSDTAPLQT